MALQAGDPASTLTASEEESGTRKRRRLRVVASCCLAAAIVQVPWVILVTDPYSGDRMFLPFGILSAVLGGLVLTLCVGPRPSWRHGGAVAPLWGLTIWLLVGVFAVEGRLALLIATPLVLLPLMVPIALLGVVGGALGAFLSLPLVADPPPSILKHMRPWHIGVAVAVAYLVVVLWLTMAGR
jgi:hypothetical protein